MRDPLSKAECVPTFVSGSKCEAFVPEVLKTVWTMCWKRWYDCISYAFRSFSEDEKESKIKGRSRLCVRPAHKAPQCGAFRGFETAV